MKPYQFYLLLMSTKQPKDQNKKIQFTPALQKLYNRICARVYRGNPRKKCSRDKLLSVQHSQILKKCSFGAMITTCRPPYQGHNSIRNRQFASETASNGNPCNHDIKMKKLTSYLTQRTTPIQFDRPFRCRTQSIKFVTTSYLAKHRQTSPDLMDTDLFQDRQNKIKSAVRNRPLFKNQQHFPSQVYSQMVRADNKMIPSKVRQMQDRRKINNMIKTKNKLAAELGKHQREQSFFKPWDVEQNDDLFF